MSDYEEQLQPERIDEQIDQLSRPSGDMAQADPDRRLLDDLHRMYRSGENEAKEDARSLERAWERIAPVVEPEYAERPRKSPQREARFVVMPDFQQTLPAPDKGRKLRHRLGLLAAAVFVTLLVGSMVFVFQAARQHIAHQGHSTTTGLATGQPPIDTSPPVPGIYLTAQKSQNNFQIIKLDRQTRKQLWSQEIKTLCYPCTPVVSGKSVYFSNRSDDRLHNYVEALDADTGAIRWQADLGSDQYTLHMQGTPPTPTSVKSGQGMTELLGTLSTPVIADGVVYVSSDRGKLFALNVVDGKQLWVYDAQTLPFAKDQITGASDGMGVGDPTRVAVEQGVIYGTIYNKLYAVDENTHRELWSVHIANTQILNAPEAVNGVVYTSSYEQSHHTEGASMTGYVYAYQARDGKPLWQFPAKSWVRSSPNVVNNMVYFSSLDHHVYALKASDGTKVWSVDTGAMVYDEPIVANGVVYANETGVTSISMGATIPAAFLAIDSTSGNVLWRKDVSTSLSMEAVQGDVIYAGLSGVVYAYDTRTGNPLWHQQVATLLKDKFGNEGAPAPILTVAG